MKKCIETQLFWSNYKHLLHEPEPWNKKKAKQHTLSSPGCSCREYCQTDGDKAGSRDAAPGGNLSNMEEMDILGICLTGTEDSR